MPVLEPICWARHLKLVAKLRLTGAVICGFKSVPKCVVKYRLIVINFRAFGSVVLSAKCVGQCGFRVAMPSPTLRPREQADLARYRSFVMNQWRFGVRESRGV